MGSFSTRQTPALFRRTAGARVTPDIFPNGLSNVRCSGRALCESRVGCAAAPIVTALAAELGRYTANPVTCSSKT